MLSLDLRDIGGRVTGAYLDLVALPGKGGQAVLAVPAGRGDDGPGMIRSRWVLLEESGAMWLKYSANVNQPERVEELGSMLRSLASWKAAEELQDAVRKVMAGEQSG